MWHFLQGWWYRTLVDAKVWEFQKSCDFDPEKMRAKLAHETANTANEFEKCHTD